VAAVAGRCGLGGLETLSAMSSSSSWTVGSAAYRGHLTLMLGTQELKGVYYPAHRAGGFVASAHSFEGAQAFSFVGKFDRPFEDLPDAPDQDKTATPLTLATIDYAMRACMKRGHPVLSRECLQEIIEATTRGIGTDESKKLAGRFVSCMSVYSGCRLTGDGCRGCDSKTPQAVACAMHACFATETAGRAAYLRMRCDYILPGSIRRGSRENESGHQRELVEKTTAMINCGRICWRVL